jgi:hypothetical protein
LRTRRLPQPASCGLSQAARAGFSRRAFLAGDPHLTRGSPYLTVAVSGARRKVRGAALRTKRSIRVWAWGQFTPAVTSACGAESGLS